MMTSATYTPENNIRLLTLITHAKGQAFFAIIALCAIILFNSFVIFFYPYDGLELYAEENFGEVYAVYPGGPGDKAGVIEGDRVLSIDERPLNRWVDEPRFRPGVRPGDVVVYKLQRGSQTLTLPIIIGSYLENGPLLRLIVGGQVLSFGFWAMGLILILFVPADDMRARLLGLGFLWAGLTVAVGGASGWNSFWGANTLKNIFWSFLALIFVVAHLTFPMVTLPRYRKRLVYIFAVAAILFSLLSIVDGWLHLREYSIANIFGVTPSQITLFFFLFSWLAGIALLIRNHLSPRDQEIRRQTGIVIWGTVLGFGPFFALSLLPYLLFGEQYVGGYASFLFLLLMPLAYIYVIHQRKLLRVDFIINRIVVFFVLVLLVLIVSILLLGVLALIFNLPKEVPLFGGLVAALISLPAGTVQKKVQRQVNQVLYGSHYDFSTVTAGLSSRLAQPLDRSILVQLLTQVLSEQMGIQRSALLLAEGDHFVLQQPIDDTFSVPPEEEMCTTLLNARTPVFAQRLRGLLPDKSAEHWQAFAWGQLFIPMIFEEQLQGILILGPRIAGDIYSDQDIQIVATVARQGALAFANVQLLEIQRGLSQRLVRSDEEGRKTLARDLHDGILQDLLFVKQKLLRGTEPVEVLQHLDNIVGQAEQMMKAQRPALLDQGLAFALRDLVSNMQRLAGEKPVVVWQDDPEIQAQLTDEQVTSIYRITQESLFNALKHAQADYIAVRLEQGSNGILRLLVKDNGVGMRKAAQPRSIKPSYGLLGMKERALMIGARLNITSRPGEGTTIILELKP